MPARPANDPSKDPRAASASQSSVLGIFARKGEALPLVDKKGGAEAPEDVVAIERSARLALAREALDELERASRGGMRVINERSPEAGYPDNPRPEDLYAHEAVFAPEPALEPEPEPEAAPRPGPKPVAATPASAPPAAPPVPQGVAQHGAQHGTRHAVPPVAQPIAQPVAPQAPPPPALRTQPAAPPPSAAPSNSERRGAPAQALALRVGLTVQAELPMVLRLALAAERLGVPVDDIVAAALEDFLDLHAGDAPDGPEAMRDAVRLIASPDRA